MIINLRVDKRISYLKGIKKTYKGLKTSECVDGDECHFFFKRRIRKKKEYDIINH